MRRLWMLVGISLLVLLPACAAATPEPAPADTPTLAVLDNTPAPQTAPTAEPALDVTPTAVPFSASSPASCTVTSTIPDPDPSIAALFAPISEDDRASGPPDAVVTILEYSDFQ